MKDLEMHAKDFNLLRTMPDTKVIALNHHTFSVPVSSFRFGKKSPIESDVKAEKSESPNKP